MLIDKKNALFKYFEIFLFLFLLSGCSSDVDNRPKSQNTNHFCRHVSAEDKKWLEKFFTDFFLEGPAIYTLFGSKPMSGVLVITSCEKEWIEAATPFFQKENETRKKEIINKIKDHCRNYDLAQNWEKWIAWKKNCPPTSFLFAKQPLDEHGFIAHVIHAPEVIWTLQKHYALFSRELNMDFDPLQVTLEFEDPLSVFWEKVLSNHLLQGILHGFGEKNAYFFSLQFGKEIDQEKRFIYEVDQNKYRIFNSALSAKDNHEGGSVKEMQLPRFRTYNSSYEEDPVFAQYVKERKLIQARLKGKDFADEVLNKIFTPTE